MGESEESKVVDIEDEVMHTGRVKRLRVVTRMFRHSRLPTAFTDIAP